MTNAHTTAPQQHDLSVPYADDSRARASIDVARWESWSYTDAGREDYYAKGHARYASLKRRATPLTYGEPMEEQGPGQRDADRETAALSDTIEIPVKCQCGFGHGNKTRRAAAGLVSDRHANGVMTSSHVRWLRGGTPAARTWKPPRC